MIRDYPMWVNYLGCLFVLGTGATILVAGWIDWVDKKAPEGKGARNMMSYLKVGLPIYGAAFAVWLVGSWLGWWG